MRLHIDSGKYKKHIIFEQILPFSLLPEQSVLLVLCGASQVKDPYKARNVTPQAKDKQLHANMRSLGVAKTFPVNADNWSSFLMR